MLTLIEIFLICCTNASKLKDEKTQKAVKFLHGLFTWKLYACGIIKKEIQP